MHIKFLIPLLGLLICCSCAQREKPKTRPLQVSLLQEPFSLDPRTGGDLYSQQIARMLFEGLTRIGLDGQPTEGLATSIDISPDGKTYTFFLKESYWSDGEPVTAHDFEYAWKTTLAPDFDANCAYALYILKNGKPAKQGAAPVDQIGVTAVNDRTLRVELEHPAPYLLELVANPMYSPVPRHVDVDDPRWSRDRLVGNGPYTVKDWRQSERILVEKNPEFWDAANVNIEGIEISMISDAPTSLEMYCKGDLDMVGKPFAEVPIDAYDSLRAQGHLKSRPYCNYYQYVFNTETPPFNNKHIRQAFAYAINRQQVIDNVLKGGEAPATTILPYHLSPHDGPLFEDGNVELARTTFEQGLQELSLTRDDLPPITLNYGIKEFSKPLAQAIQQQWQTALGIPIRIRGNDWNAHFADYVEGNFQIASMGWHCYYNDPSYNLEQVKFADDRINASGWENQNFITYLDLADQEADPNQRQFYFHRAEALLMDEMPICPIFMNTLKYLQSDQLEDVVFTSLGQVDFRWAKLKTPT